MKRFYDISLLGQHTKKYLFHRVDCNLKTDDYIISDMIFIAPSNRIPIQSTVFETVPRFPKIVSIDQHLMLRNLLITTEDVNPANMEVNFPTGILFAIHLPTPHNLLNPFFNPLRSLEAFLATNFTKDPKGPASLDLSAALPYAFAILFTGANKEPIPGSKLSKKSAIAETIHLLITKNPW